jgi:flagellin
MALSIVSNVASLLAQNALSNTTTSLNASLQRLSTGLQINTAADGPAAYVASQEQKAQLAGIQTAISNTSKATDLLQTADGALGEISNLLTQVRGLAVEAANSGVEDSTAVAAIQAQIHNALQTIDSIASNTQFGNQHLLDGSAANSITSSQSGALTGLQATSAVKSGTYTVSSDGSSDGQCRCLEYELPEWLP